MAMGAIQLVCVAVVGAALAAVPAHARADNAKPGEEERLEWRGGGAAATPAVPHATQRVIKPRLEKRKKRRYILM